MKLLIQDHCKIYAEIEVIIQVMPFFCLVVPRTTLHAATIADRQMHSI